LARVSTPLDARGDPPSPVAIGAAVAALAGGGVVGLPTDTVYGLAADPWRPGATERLFELKGRPRHVELPVFVAGADQAARLSVGLTPIARILMERYWPGPLTIVVPRRPDLGADLGTDPTTIGLRCPAHPVPLAICQAQGPYATTSANRHGQPPISEAATLAAELPGVDLVLDAGPCAGVPSTVVDATGERLRLLRAGAIPWEDLTALEG
jgi:L-threonylcarbamoyladenylate synthase